MWRSWNSSKHRTFSCKGSIVVEAAIVIPVVILSIIAVIYMSFVIFQKAYLQSLADRTAEGGAVFWKSRYRNVETGKNYKICPEGMELYWWLCDTSNREKKEILKASLTRRAGRYSVIKAADKEADVILLNYVIGKKVKVTIEETYKIPAADILKIFGIKNTYKIIASSEAVISDADELIRNIDFLIDIERELEERHPDLKATGDKVRNIVKDVEKRIKSLFQ